MSDTITFTPDKRKRNADLITRLAYAARNGDYSAMADIQEETVIIGETVLNKMKHTNAENLSDEDVADWAFALNFNKTIVNVARMTLTKSEYQYLLEIIRSRAPNPPNPANDN